MNIAGKPEDDISMERKIIGITMGDPSGIGPEVTVKALAKKSIYERCIPVVYGDEDPIKDAISFCRTKQKLNIIQEPSEAKGEYGVIDRADTKSTLNWIKDINNVFNYYGIGRALWSYKKMDFGLIDSHYSAIYDEMIKYL